ncbi:LysR family transcriptional regulator [Mesorhizobium sanjuanii]|uniref:LysR family transcriptional regulator n=1 Tax=Mesorhizobium sanjuanii TaxID=2037900 RepID=A0A2A6FJ92_9HYPH|nr:LysR family transcriptional regulator [Mesorhizobium sanjuanii]PDQ21711.1 LysR family transcriptional regulator [Mesorhizobium sanjuanii]
MRAPKLIELEAVVAVARRKTFRAAARELNASPTAIGNAVAGLEDELGVRLFDRTTRRVDLTAAGHELVRAIAPALAEIHAATAVARGVDGAPAGTLRINCSIAGGHQLLVPFVNEVLRRHRDVKVDIVTEGRLVDIVQSGFDAGVRTQGAMPPNMAAVSLGRRLRNVVVASPGYFAAHARPRHPDDLQEHTCIRIRWPSGLPYEWEFERGGEVLQADVPWSLSLDNHGLIARAALAGVGLAYVAEAEVAEHIAAGRLLAVLQDWMPVNPEFQLYYPARRPVPAHLAAFVEVVEELRGG